MLVTMDEKADNKAVSETVLDRGEAISDMEPLLIGETSRHRAKLTDMAVELAQKAAGFRRSLPASLLSSLANLVRAMNCYYSNLIEGHYTHPVDIERALKNDYSKEAKKRDLQLEAKAHIAVQEWIDGGGLNGRATTEEGVRETHKRFCELLPEDLLWVEDPKTKERVRVVPGRTAPARGGCRYTCRRERGSSSPLFDTFLGSLWRSEQNGFDPRGSNGTSPVAVDSSVSRRKRACGTSYVARHASRESRHRCGVVGCERTGSQRRSLQAAFDGVRSAAAQRSRWPWPTERRSARVIYGVFPRRLHRPSGFHGEPGAAGPSTHAHSSMGRGRDGARTLASEIEQHSGSRPLSRGASAWRCGWSGEHRRSPGATDRFRCCLTPACWFQKAHELRYG